MQIKYILTWYVTYVPYVTKKTYITWIFSRACVYMYYVLEIG